MNVYLAARYSRREELCEYRLQLQADGHTVTSRWLNGAHQITKEGIPIDDTGESLIENGTCEEAARLRREFVLEDVADVYAADVVVSFTEPPRSNQSRGGRHVEFGMAVALDKRLVVVGYRENLFHYLPQVEFFTTWEAARASLSGESADDAGDCPIEAALNKGRNAGMNDLGTCGVPSGEVARLNMMGDALAGTRGPDQMRIASVCLEWTCLLLAKNADYGSSVWKRPRLVPSLSAGEGILVRITDKVERLERIVANGSQLAEESFEDTMRDLGAYCLLWLANPERDYAGECPIEPTKEEVSDGTTTKRNDAARP